MIYLLYGNNEYLINKEIDKINKDIDKISINSYNLLDSDLKDIINDACTIDLFNITKSIIVYNSYIFLSTTNKKNKEQKIELLEEYINNQNKNTNLIFIVNSDKIDERKKITKLLKEKGKIISFNNEINIHDFILNCFKDYKIDNDSIKLLIDRVGTDVYILENEIDKIKLYKENDKNVTKEDILLLTQKNINLDIFNLIEHIINKNIEDAYIEYKEIVKTEEPIKILIMLANQFRIIYQTKELYSKGYTEGDIASILNIHPYRIKLALSKSKNYESNMILNYLYTLANLDIDIKSGKIDPYLGLELFILNLKECY